MKKHDIRTAFTRLFLCLSVLMTLSACSFITSHDASSRTQATMLHVTVVDAADARGAALPHLTANDFTAFSLTGAVTEDSPVSGIAVSESFTATEEKTACQSLSDASIPVTAGAVYDMTLTASKNGLTYRATLSAVEIHAGDNSLTFELSIFSLTAPAGSGDLRITLSLLEAVALVYAGLYDTSGTQVLGYEDEPLTITASAVTYAKTDVPAGTYIVLFKLYGADEAGSGSPALYLAPYREYATIIDGVETVSNPMMTAVDSVCSIEYVNADGSAFEGGAGGTLTGTATGSFTRHTESVVLAQAVKTGVIFAGWYPSATTGTLGTLVGFPGEGGGVTGKDLFALASASHTVTLYARWIEPVLYVAENGTADGSGEDDGLSSANAFSSLSQAFSQITSLVSTYSVSNAIDGTSVISALGWTVYVTGTLTGTTSLQSSPPAASLLITGTENTSTLYGNGEGTVLTVNCAVPVTITNIALTGGSANGGGGLFVGSSATVTLGEDCVITGNESALNETTPSNGGGVYSSGSLTISGATISGNTAASGAGVYSTGTLTMTGGEISGNTASSLGGGVYSSGLLVIAGATISGNTAASGAGVYSTGTLGLASGEISGNTATNDGGGIYNDGAGEITGGEISGNTASSNGGGIYSTGYVTIGGGTISANTAATHGGGIYNSGTVTIDGGTISANTAATTGGGIHAAGGTVTLNDGTLTENTTTATDGSTIRIETAAEFTLSGGTIAANTCRAVDNRGTFTMTGGTISDHTIAGKGAAVYSGITSGSTSGGIFTMSGGTITGNSSSGDNGGAIYNGGTFTLSGGTISANSSAAYGGGVCNSSVFTMTGGTISANTATTGGGGFATWGTATLGGSAYIPAGTDGNNDVFLYSGGSHTYLLIESSLTATTPVATLTPGSYVSGRKMIDLSDDSTATLADEYEKFAVTQPSAASWLILSDGTLQNVTGSLDVTLPSWEDIEVTVTVNDTTVTARPISASVGDTVVFAATSGAESYTWTIDDTAASSVTGATASSSTLTLSTTGWTAGSYDIVLEAACADGLYSYFASLSLQ